MSRTFAMEYELKFPNEIAGVARSLSDLWVSTATVELSNKFSAVAYGRAASYGVALQESESGNRSGTAYVQASSPEQAHALAADCIAHVLESIRKDYQDSLRYRPADQMPSIRHIELGDGGLGPAREVSARPALAPGVVKTLENGLIVGKAPIAVTDGGLLYGTSIAAMSSILRQSDAASDLLGAGPRLIRTGPASASVEMVLRREMPVDIFERLVSAAVSIAITDRPTAVGAVSEHRKVARTAGALVAKAVSARDLAADAASGLAERPVVASLLRRAGANHRAPEAGPTSPSSL